MSVVAVLFVLMLALFATIVANKGFFTVKEGIDYGEKPIPYSTALVLLIGALSRAYTNALSRIPRSNKENITLSQKKRDIGAGVYVTLKKY